jgi:imidazole glycerol phosphate synthase glutamine amidotransferase subunit
MGNLKSVQNAARLLGYSAVITESPATIKKADKIVFPGVGHFAQAVRELRKRKLTSLLQGKIREGTPFLGICLGMQILFEKSEEAPGLSGFGIIKGCVKRFRDRKLIVPHMGWNQIRLQLSGRRKQKKLFKGIKDNSFFYFVHSYYCEPANKQCVLTTTKYGHSFASSIHHENIWAVQFHAEKSQKLGLQLLKNFLSVC